MRSEKGYLEEGYLMSERGFKVKAIQSMTRPWMFGFSRDGQ